MKVYEKTADLQRDLQLFHSQNKTIGFVPTMGALHEGHLTLVRRCASENDVCVVSIFVNPTQFNNKNDLENYPRTLNHDVELLKGIGESIVIFSPTEKEIYPEPDSRIFDFGLLDKVMEGTHRPGHFNGVAQVVSRLFEIVKPTKAYFGEKDFQQLAIIRELVKQLRIPVEIVGCPIVREADGMALSSRNVRLSEEERGKAVLISQTLLKSCNFVSQKSVTELKEWVITQINSEPLLDVEYFEIVDAVTLQPIDNWDDSPYIAGCITVYCGDVRLIDNIQYKK